MPATALQISSVINALNEVGPRDIYPQFDESTIALDRIEKGGDDGLKAFSTLAYREGKYIRIQAHVSGNPNVGVGVREGREYTRPGSQGYDVLKYRLKRIHAGMSHTIEAESHAGGGEQSAFDAPAQEMAACIQNIRKRQNKIILGDGSATLCSVPASGNNWTNATPATLVVDDASDMKVGMEIIVRTKTGGGDGTGATPALTEGGANAWPSTTDSAGNTIYKPAKVTAVNTSTNTLSLQYYNGVNIVNTTQTLCNSMGVYPWDSQAAVPWGLQIACDNVNPSAHGWTPGGAPPTDAVGMSCAFGALDRTTAANAWWKGTVTDLAGASVNLKDHLQNLRRTLLKRDGSLSGRTSILGICDPSIVDQITNALTAGQRTWKNITINTNKPMSLNDGLYDAVAFDIFAFVGDSDVHKGSSSTSYGRVLFFDPDKFYRYILTPWGLEKGPDGVTWHQSEGPYGRMTSEFYAYLATEQQLVCTSCLGNAMFDNVAL